MRYIDTGSRNPDETLGTWLRQNVFEASDVIGLRFQTGFFNAKSLGYFAPLLNDLREQNGILRVLIGSNDGVTAREDLEALLELAGPPRPDRQVGVVTFNRGYFHPKVIHLTRADESEAAYVGSANLTESGVSSLHVEAGLLVDTKLGDDHSVLGDIASAIDEWFEEERQGLTLIEAPTDLDALVEANMLDVPRTPLGEGQAGGSQDGTKIRLEPLVDVPVVGVPGPAVGETKWSKKLTRSDAQRKQRGHQRGSITLVAAGHPVDTQTYFRYELFSGADWQTATTKTGELREEATIPFDTVFLGESLGVLHLTVTYAENRESGQLNYTSLLHLGPLAPQFLRTDVTGRLLRIGRSADGRFMLSVE